MKSRVPLTVLFMLGGFIMVMLAAPPGSHGVRKFYPRTPSGVIEIKTIPESRILVTESDGSYFDESNQLFGRLFDYIKVHSIPMTSPVEGSVDDQARMIFYLGADLADEGLTDEGQVRVVRLPERTVISIGGWGSYKEKNVRKYMDRLKTHLAGRSDYEAVGPAYTVFWNPPFIPWFLRHLEVHIPVRPAGNGPGK